MSSILDKIETPVAYSSANYQFGAERKDKEEDWILRIHLCTVWS